MHTHINIQTKQKHPNIVDFNRTTLWSVHEGKEEECEVRTCVAREHFKSTTGVCLLESIAET
jgi:hypothetical protein